MEKGKKEKGEEKYPQSEETGSLKQFKVLININTLYNIYDIIYIYINNTKYSKLALLEMGKLSKLPYFLMHLRKDREKCNVKEQ